VARKQGRWRGKASAGKEIHSEIVLCFRRKRRARGRSTGSPYTDVPQEVVLALCPPGPRTGCAHGFSAQRPCFLAGKRNRANFDSCRTLAMVLYFLNGDSAMIIIIWVAWSLRRGPW